MIDLNIADELVELKSKRKALIYYAPKTFGADSKTSEIFGSYIEAIRKVCTQCQKVIPRSNWEHLIFCKACAYTECRSCSESYFAESPKLTQCPVCETMDWPFMNDDEEPIEDVPKFFHSLWRSMGRDIADFETKV